MRGVSGACSAVFGLVPAFLAMVLWVHAGAALAKGTSLSPAESLNELVEGNRRFSAGAAVHPRQDTRSRLETARLGQAPIALVLACSDSREAVEALFDQGIGDLFVVRVAGNTTGAPVLGSVEYAVEHLHIPLIVVLGHTQCGAVESAWQGGEVTGNLAALIASIMPAVQEVKREYADLKDEDALKRRAEIRNVRNSIADILANNATAVRLVKENKLRVLGAIYDIESGKVSWLDDVKRTSATQPPVLPS